MSRRESQNALGIPTFIVVGANRLVIWHGAWQLYCDTGGCYLGFPGTWGKDGRGVRVGGGGTLAGTTFQEAQESLFVA